MYFPLLGRLSLVEWFLVSVSFLLSWTEYVFQLITKLLPTPVISAFTYTLKLVYHSTSNPIDFITKQRSLRESDENVVFKYVSSDEAHERERLMTGILNGTDITEICALFGYTVESHIVKTTDGYLLTVQRIIGKAGGEPPRNGKVVYLHHGLLMCSEIWVTMLDKDNNLPFVLYDLGYDVWFGNNRGNKYCHKHVSRPLNTEQFWNFSIDEFALYDIPDSIGFILRHCKQKTLTYIGFSQGTAQAFASVSVNPQLNEQIERIIAISPATTPHGLYSKFLDILLKSSPNIIYLIFSRKVLMPSVLFWQRIMYPPFFDSSIDASNYMLFNWKSENIDKDQKVCSYAHLYSTTSVKTVVHWFQIMASKTFQMYHDPSSSISSLNPVTYPLKNIRIPIHLIYGDIDSLVDIDVMRDSLPEKTTFSHAVVNHEHLDNIWGRDVATEVWPAVLEALGENKVVQPKAIEPAKLLEPLEPAKPVETVKLVNASSTKSSVML